MKRHILLLSAAFFALTGLASPRVETTLNDGWQFTKGDGQTGAEWQSVTVPHDWAIYGPFDRNNDLQTVAIEQNGENIASVKTGRTGGLPFIGKGTYKTTFEVPDTAGRALSLVFDGAMSNAHVKVNGKEVAYWPYGYNSFVADINGFAKPGKNDLEVSLENFERASRWYPGAGLYRNVHLIDTDRIHVPVWGTYVTTPTVKDDYASVEMQLEIAGTRQFPEWPYGEKVDVLTTIYSPQGKEVASNNTVFTSRGQGLKQNFIVKNPELWSPETPNLYTAKTELKQDGKVLDTYETRFGIRTL